MEKSSGETLHLLSNYGVRFGTLLCLLTAHFQLLALLRPFLNVSGSPKVGTNKVLGFCREFRQTTFIGHRRHVKMTSTSVTTECWTVDCNDICYFTTT